MRKILTFPTIDIGKLPSKLERGVVGTTTGEQSKTKMTAQFQNPSSAQVKRSRKGNGG